MSGTLNSWDTYIEKLDGRKPNPKLATFHARYKFAYNLEGMQIREMSESLTRLYYLVTKLGFAYSALENLERTLGLGHDSPISAPDLATQIRASFSLSLDRIENRMYLTNTLRMRLEQFFGDSSITDVRPIIEQFRHSLFHGKFTPTGWGLRSDSRSANLVEGLSQVTLRQADATFTRWFKKQVKSGLQQI